MERITNATAAALLPLIQSRILSPVDPKNPPADFKEGKFMIFIGGGNASGKTVINNLIFENLEKQVVKMRAKWRDTHRHKKDKAAVPAPEPVVPPSGKKSKAALAANNSKKPSRVFKVDHQDGRKPMTLEEAMLEMGNSQDYMVYRDAVTNKISVLMRRGDGHLDLVES